MRRKTFCGLLLAGPLALFAKTPESLRIARLRRKWSPMWNAAQGGMLAKITMVDLRDQSNPVQYQVGIVLPKGTAAKEAEKRLTNLGLSAGRKVSYLTGRYDDWPEENGAAI